MLEVKLLGTGGTMPLVNRYLTSLLVKYNGNKILVDCGEATQLSLSAAVESAKDINIMCITHFHADHISGLPGMILLMGNQGKTDDLNIYGPKGIHDIVKSLLVIAPKIPFKINIYEINDNDELNTNIDNFKIVPFKLLHKTICFGYTFNLDRLPKFDVDKAIKNNIEKRYWTRLQHGNTIQVGDITYTPDMVLGDRRKGLKITYCTDTLPIQEIALNAKDSDLFICEGMYYDKEKVEHANNKRHMMMQDAARIAEIACVKELWLTHFSTSLINPRSHTKDIRNIFNNTIIPKDGHSKILKFEN